MTYKLGFSIANKRKHALVSQISSLGAVSSIFQGGSFPLDGEESNGHPAELKLKNASPKGR
jgi:hypothetical protein